MAPGVHRVAIVARPTSLRQLQALVDAATLVSLAYLHDHPDTPPVAQLARYAREPRDLTPGADTALQEERFLTTSSLRAVGRGDCDDLAPCRAAELLARGIPARAVIYATRRGGYHVVVATPWGIEDPSAALGMGVPSSP